MCLAICVPPGRGGGEEGWGWVHTIIVQETGVCRA